jgi:hypothetical protein
LIAPEPDPINDWMLKITSMCGKWLSMNLLTIDEERVIVDSHHTGMMRALEKWGFEPVPCEFLHMPRSAERFIAPPWTSAAEVHCKVISDPEIRPLGHRQRVVYEEILKPTMPAKISPIQFNRRPVAGSLKR